MTTNEEIMTTNEEINEQTKTNIAETKRKRGRFKGSKNKKLTEEERARIAEEKKIPKKKGRPKTVLDKRQNSIDLQRKYRRLDKVKNEKKDLVLSTLMNKFPDVHNFILTSIEK